MIKRATCTASALMALAVSACSGPAGPAPGSAYPSTAEREAKLSRKSTAPKSVQMRDLDRYPVSDMAEYLAQHVSGLRLVQGPNGRPALRIRGASSVMATNDPLVVIDGVAVPRYGLDAVLVGLVPADIARVTVLKDAGSTSFYGVRGSNGVILIETKRGR